MSRRALPRPRGARLEHVLAVGMRALSIGMMQDTDCGSGESLEQNQQTPESAPKRARDPPATPDRAVARKGADSKEAILPYSEDAFKEATDSATTVEEICEAANLFLRWTSRECKSGPVSLELKRGPDPRLEECVGNTRKPFIAFQEKDYYLVLTFEAACTLSVVGIKREDAVHGAEPMFENDYLEIFSNTADSQTCKGYNTILRAVAVMIACMQGMVLYSFNVNEQNLSSYTLMRSYEFLQCNEREPRGPLTQQDACAASKRNVDDVGVTPTQENFRRAQEIMTTRAVECAGAERRRGAPGIPPLHRRDACPPCQAEDAS
tara:strand:+ start:468 stop:1430 length:963 start_codon:yes stop_codon:yes gene_type:complete